MKVREQIADQRTVQNPVIGLVAVIQQAFTARTAAAVRGSILPGVGVVVANRKRPARERGQHLA